MLDDESVKRKKCVLLAVPNRASLSLFMGCKGISSLASLVVSSSISSSSSSSPGFLMMSDMKIAIRKTCEKRNERVHVYFRASVYLCEYVYVYVCVFISLSVSMRVCVRVCVRHPRVNYRQRCWMVLNLETNKNV